MARSPKLPKWCSIVRSNPAAYERDVFALPAIHSPADAVAFFRSTLQRSEVEQFLCLSLDSQHRPLGVTRVTSGLLNTSLVHVRETFRVAIVLNAACIIVAHNHPSGDPTPSMDDRNVTEQLQAAGRIIEIPVFDHIIIAGERWTSFAEAGLL